MSNWQRVLAGNEEELIEAADEAPPPARAGTEEVMEETDSASPPAPRGGLKGLRRAAGVAVPAGVLLVVGALCWLGAGGRVTGPGAVGTGGEPEILPPGAELGEVEALWEEGGRAATVSFTHKGMKHQYRLQASSVYAQGADIVEVGEDGDAQLERGPIRTFRARDEAGRWANAVLNEDGSIKGIFTHEGRIMRVRPYRGLLQGGKHVVHELPQDHFEKILMGNNNSARGLTITGRRLGHDIDVDTVKNGEWGVSQGHDWPHDEMVPLGRENSNWKGTRWYPGCYAGDKDPHSFVIGIQTDVKAHKHNGGTAKLKKLMEETVHEASIIYEQQMHIRLLIGKLTVYSSPRTAPKQARDCGMIPGKASEEGYRTLKYKLTALTGDKEKPFMAATHLFTSCVMADVTGSWSMTVGLAFVGSACRNQNTAANMIMGDSTFETFAHELGHNIHGSHSFEEGQGSTGGIMDYGDGKHDGVYQFNTKHRKSEICGYLNKIVGKCEDKFAVTASGGSEPPAAKCRGVGGEKCEFPFTYDGDSHSTCTTEAHNMPWCATAKGWANCKCCKYKTTEGDKCRFPFKYHGNTYHTCTDSNHTHMWCYTRRGWGNCDMSCGR